MYVERRWQSDFGESILVTTELEYEVEKLKYKTFLGHEAEDQNQIRKFYIRYWLTRSIIY